MTAGNPKYQFGYPQQYLLSRALPQFAETFEEFLIAHEHPVSFFTKLSKQYELEVFVNEDVHPDFYKQLKKLKDAGVIMHLFRDQLTIPKDTKTKTGDRYSVFTPFRNAVWSAFVQEEEDKMPSLSGVTYLDLKEIKCERIKADTDEIQKLFSQEQNFLVDKKVFDIRTLNLPDQKLNGWYFPEKEALKHFDQYLKNQMEDYKEARDLLSTDGTSKMSLALTWGLVSARTLVAKLKGHFNSSFENPLASHNHGPIHYISELIWREFYKYLYFHDPSLFSKPFQKKFESVSWQKDKDAQKRFIVWIEGKTGYPIVDAAMMQVATSGWMHNRARMIVSSVLTKNFGIDWRWGQEYFRAMLIDLDEASNIGGWQWGASVGADPKPIRIFNPHLQSKKFDANREYQKRWLPEEYLENPPKEIIDHKNARENALKLYGLGKRK